MIDNGEGRRLQDKVTLPRHESGEEFSGPSDVYKYPKPVKSRLKNDTSHRKERSKQQERELSRSYQKSGYEKARRIPGSGAFQGLKGDIDPGEWFLGEAKQTRQGRLVIDPVWYDKIAREAKDLGRPWWALHAWVGNETSSYRRVVVLDEPHFFELIKMIKDNSE